VATFPWGQNSVFSVAFHRAEHNVERNFTSVFSLTKKFKGRTHRPQARRSMEAMPMLQVLAPQALRQQHFDGVTHQFRLLVAKDAQ
jgi:hypothetical protein